MITQRKQFSPSHSEYECCMSFKGPGEMAIVILIIDRYVLIEILDNCLIPFIEHRSNVFVWERYLKNYDISSELDPIENLW